MYVTYVRCLCKVMLIATECLATGLTNLVLLVSATSNMNNSWIYTYIYVYICIYIHIILYNYIFINVYEIYIDLQKVRTSHVVPHKYSTNRKKYIYIYRWYMIVICTMYVSIIVDCSLFLCNISKMNNSMVIDVQWVLKNTWQLISNIKH